MTDATVPTVLAGAPIDEREEKLRDGAATLGGPGRTGFLIGNERSLVVVSATLMTIGLTLILLGWAGAAGTTILEEQVPYLISGGILGLALSTIGALTLFCHWLTVLIREIRGFEAVRRQEHAALVAALDRRDDHDGLVAAIEQLAAATSAPRRRQLRASDVDETAGG